MRRLHKDHHICQLYKIEFVTCLFIIFSSLCLAQNNTISGSVINNKSLEPVRFITVTLLNATDSTLQKGVLTDSLGGFTFLNIPKGEYYLTCHSLEYIDYNQRVKVLDYPINISVGIIYLSEGVKTLDAVKVLSQKLAFQPTENGVLINLENDLFKTSVNIIDVLKKSPSIQVSEGGILLMRNSIVPKVLINNRDVPMGVDELRNYMNTLRPDEVESIEINTNPSAQYDAEYKGIVNIRLKRDRALGLTGNVTGTLQIGKYNSGMNNLSLTYKTRKVAYTSRLGYSSLGSFEDDTFNQILNNGTTLFTKLYIPYRNKSFDYMFGVDYYLSKKHVVGIQLRAFDGTITTPISTVTQFRNELQILQLKNSKNDLINNNRNYSVNGYYEGNFKKGQITLSTSIVKFSNQQNQFFKDIDTISTFDRKGEFVNTTKIFSSQLMYSLNLKKAKLNLGYKATFTTVNNDAQYLLQNEERWIYDDVNSNIFLYDERNLAFFGTYSNSFKKASYTFGLRTESTNLTGNSTTLDVITKRNYTKFLPSFNINLPINENNSISFSSSRRLTRPSFSALNPFIYIAGPFTSYGGNQNLVPVVNTSHVLSYYFKNVYFSASLGINRFDIQQVPVYDVTSNKTTYFYKNLSSNKYQGAEVGIPIKITKWWTTQTNLRYYINRYALPILNEDIHTKINSFGMNNSHTIKLNKGYNFSIMGQFETGGGTALFSLKPKGSLNLGIQKMYFNKLSANLSANDVFFTYLVNTSSIRPDIINLRTTGKHGSRYILLQLSYTFGKSTYNSKQVEISSQDEENRARR